MDSETTSHVKDFSWKFKNIKTIIRSTLSLSVAYYLNCRNMLFYSTVKDCGALKAPVNGSLVGNLTTYPHKVQFMCDEGFNLRGSKIRQCLSTGNWSGQDSFCEGIDRVITKVLV